MKDNKVTKKVITYIESHLQEELSLDQIAKELNYSKFYIARSFAEDTGSTIYKYIQGRRLSIAAKQLVETQKPIVEIALEAKYNSQQAFTLAFRQVYLCAPLAYRKQGTFYPKQPTLEFQNISCYHAGSVNMGGRMAA